MVNNFYNVPHVIINNYSIKKLQEKKNRGKNMSQVKNDKNISCQNFEHHGIFQL
jgi:hypothetical protein